MKKIPIGQMRMNSQGEPCRLLKQEVTNLLLQSSTFTALTGQNITADF
jgi:hypothetical protein